MTSVLVPHMTDAEDKQVLKSLLRDVFPATARPRSSQTTQPNKQLTQAIEDYLKSNHMTSNEEIITRVGAIEYLKKICFCMKIT